MNTINKINNIKFNNNSDIEWVMFDLGNVIIEYNPIVCKEIAITYDIDEKETEEFFLKNNLFEMLCKGEIEDYKFLKIINKKFHCKIKMKELIYLYSKELENLIEGIDTIIYKLKENNYKLALLSNIFFAHWDAIKQYREDLTNIFERFDIIIASHLVKAIKPHYEIYNKAIKLMETDPQKVIFIDDKIENIKGAQKLGINAYQSLNIDDTIEGLKKHKIIEIS